MKMSKLAVKVFEERQVRTVWDADQEKWYVSIVDVVAVLTESADATAYWRKLKQRLKAEGNETVTNCHGLKMLAAAEPVCGEGLLSRAGVWINKPRSESRVYLIMAGGMGLPIR